MAIRLQMGDRLRSGQHGWLGLALLGLFLLLARLDVEPVPTFFYVCAWYPALLVVDALVQRRSGASLLVARPVVLLCLFGWSLPFWLMFEALNLRVENWYYVNTPASPVAGRVFLVLAFATVLPGLIEVYDLVRCYRPFDRLRTPRFHAGRRVRSGMLVAGGLMLLLPLAFPRFCYPLIWGFMVLLLEPFNRRPGWPSLLRDLERGRPGRLLAMLSAGLVCGLLWEVMNLPARARWIYTVPFFDATLGVEMPPLGFLGFLPFALEAYSFLRAAEILGLSAPFEPEARGPVAVPLGPATRLAALPALVAALGIWTILGIESRTVDSSVPRVADLCCTSRREAAALELFGLGDVRDFIAEADEPGGADRLARRLLVENTRIDRLLAEARLADLRGIGAQNTGLLGAVGVRSVTDLARQDPADLYARLKQLGAPARSVRPQRVRVWVRAATAAETQR